MQPSCPTYLARVEPDKASDSTRPSHNEGCSIPKMLVIVGAISAGLEVCPKRPFCTLLPEMIRGTCVS